jgi:phosphatidyl-myo-inositol dimannoside synthase
MKFLLTTLEYFPFKGGVSNYYTNLVYYWPKAGQIFVLNNNSNELLCRHGFLKWRKAIFAIKNFVLKNEIDHVIIGHVLPLGTAMFIVSKIIKIKYSVVLHGMDLSLATRNRWKRFITRLILERADKIITPNHYTAKMCAKFLSREKLDFMDKIKVVNPGVKDFSDFNQGEESELRAQSIRENNNLGDSLLLFSLGRLVKRKGVDKVILALKLIYQKYPDINLEYIIAGKGPDEEYLKQLVKTELGDKFSNKVKFVGEISEKEKWSLFSMIDIFIMPARNISGDFEGFGIVYLEANLCGKAVIAGNSGGVPDAVQNNVNGLLVDPENEEEIAQAILKLCSDKQWREKLGDQGRQRALIKFTWKNQVESFFDFLNK